ncbi:MAG: TonB-dependent receptor, partial [Methylomonas sp.]|nr:TonB-dependent receptor [Methylomonas sp.]
MTLAIKGLAVAITLISAQAHAEDGKHRFDIPAQALAGALQTLAAQSGAAMLYTEQTAAGKTSPALQGEYTLEEAVRKLLSGSGLIYSIDGSGTVTLKPAPGGRNATTLEPLTVKGVRNPNDPYDMDYAVTNATTATKTDTPLMETPVSIQVIPKGVLADKQSMTLPEAVNGHVSGVLGRTGGGFLYDNFIIRGLAGSGFGDAYRNGLFNRQDIYDIANIERIEILKGPAAVLYGRIEPGGLVNYVTKKPLDTPYYSLQQQFGSYDQYRTLVDATGPIDDDKTLLYRLNGSYTDNESFRDFVGNRRFFVAPSLTWRPNDRFESNLELEYKHDDFNADSGIPAIGDRPAPIPFDRSLKDGFQRQTVESTLVGFDWTYRFNNDWKLTQRYLFKDWSLSGPAIFSGGLQANNR